MQLKLVNHKKMNAGNSLAMNMKRISAETFCPTTQAC